MAAILEPHRFPRTSAPARPELRLIPGGLGAPATPRRTSPVPFVLAGLLVLALMFGAVAVGRGALAGLAPAPAAATSSAGGPSVVVEPGDTLWSIARRLQPTGDVRPLVDRLVAAHGTAAIEPGDRIALPN